MANFNLNKAILGGRLAAVPELKTTSSGAAVCSFNLAVNRRHSKDSESVADFISVVAWRQTAEFICKYFKKGSSLCVVGTIQTRSWTDQNGNKRYATEVVADEAYFVDSKIEGSSAGASIAADAYAAPRFEEVGADEDLPF